MIVLVVIALVVGGLAHLLDSPRQKGIQTNRNVTADTILNIEQAAQNQVLESGQPFYLYLRPFSIAQDFTVANPRAQEGNPFIPANLHGKYFSFEEVLVDAFAEIAPVIKFSSREDGLGGGHVEVPDEGWFDHFERLAVAAKLIIVLPFHSASSMREVRWLKDYGHLVKTVFVLPPWHSSQLKQLMLKAWPEVRDVYAAYGLMLPDLQPLAFVTLDSDGRYRNSVTVFPDGDAKGYVRAFKRLGLLTKANKPCNLTGEDMRPSAGTPVAR
jgi:hypothetical protein